MYDLVLLDVVTLCRVQGLGDQILGSVQHVQHFLSMPKEMLAAWIVFYVYLARETIVQTYLPYRLCGCNASVPVCFPGRTAMYVFFWLSLIRHFTQDAHA
jgi:hypothetical protein